VFSDALIWALVIVLFTVAEGMTVGLTSIWFSVGGLAALLISFFTGNHWVQIWGFLIVSALCLLALRPAAKRYFSKGKGEATNFDRIVGQQGIVTEEVCNLENRGQVQINGQDWSARSVSGLVIPQGTTVIIRRIEGVKVFVEPAV
jgi:membrane protein implicated in regulation of membrane protease activity